MIVSIQGLVIIAAALLLFGGAIYDITTTAGRCALSVTDPAANYSCNDMWSTLGKTVVMPDQNVLKGTLGIQSIREADPSMLDSLGILPETQTASYRNQIIIGVIGVAVLFLFFAWIFIKISPASGIDAGSLGVAVLCSFLTLSLIMVMFDDGPDPGFLSIPGVNTPFKGIRTLISNPEVFSDVVDSSSVLPGTLTTEDIVNGT